MPFVPAKCTQCGAELEVDNSMEAAVCKYCNTPFIVEKAINNYNTFVTNNFAGANVTVQGRESADVLADLGDKYTINQSFELALDYYRQIKRYYPNDGRGPLGCVTGLTKNYSIIPTSQNDLDEIKKDRERIRVLSGENVYRDISDKLLNTAKSINGEKIIWICPKCSSTYSINKGEPGEKCPTDRSELVNTDIPRPYWKLLNDQEKENIKNQYKTIEKKSIFGFLK